MPLFNQYLLFVSFLLTIQSQFQTIYVNLAIKSNADKSKHKIIQFSYLFNNNTNISFACYDLFDQVTKFCVINELNIETCIKLITQASIKQLNNHNFDHFFDPSDALLNGQSIEAQLSQVISIYRPKLALLYASHSTNTTHTDTWTMSDGTDDGTQSEDICDDMIWNVSRSALKRDYHISSVVFNDNLSAYKPVRRVCFIHSCALYNHPTPFAVLHEILDTLISSTLYDELLFIIVVSYGQNIHQASSTIDKYQNYDKIYFIQRSSDTTLYEIPTIRHMHAWSIRILNYTTATTTTTCTHVGTCTADSTTTDTLGTRRSEEGLAGTAQILYLHTKGISYEVYTPGVTDWRHMMLYYLVIHHRKCYHILHSMLYDTIGVNYAKFKENRHYSGNYWWTTVQYISQLPYIPITSSKYQAEFCLFKFPVSGRHICLHTSNVDHGAVHYQRRAISASVPEINSGFGTAGSWLDVTSHECKEKLTYSSYHNYDLSTNNRVIMSCIGFSLYNITCNYTSNE